MVHLTFRLLELSSDEPFHLDIIIVVELFGVYFPLVDTLSDFHGRSNSKLPLHLFLRDTPTNGTAQCRRVSSNTFGPTINERLVLVGAVALAA